MQATGVLSDYLRQMMPAAQAARLAAGYGKALRILGRMACAADIRSRLMDGVDIVAGDTRSVVHSLHPVPARELLPGRAGTGRVRVPGYRSAGRAAPKGGVWARPRDRCSGRGRGACRAYDEVSGSLRSGGRDLWASCDDFDPDLSWCGGRAGYCLPAGEDRPAESSGYVSKVDLVGTLSEMAGEAGYGPRPACAGLPFIRQAHLTGCASELWRKAAREWRMQGRLSEQVLMMSALAMRPAIHHRESTGLIDDVWTLSGYYGDMGAADAAARAGLVPGAGGLAGIALPGDAGCVWRRRTVANGIAVGFWNRLRAASMNLECGSRRDVIRLVSMDDRSAVRFLALDTCVPFLIRPDAACWDMADSTLAQILGGTGDVVDDIWSGEWANGLLVALGSAEFAAGRVSMRGVLADIDDRYLECLTMRRYAPLAQMALCVPVWQALNGRHMLIERASSYGTAPGWAWPDELISLAVGEIRDVAGHGSFKRSGQQAGKLADDAIFMQLAGDPVCHALLDADRYDTYLMLGLLEYLFASCQCSPTRTCRLHEPHSLMCSDAAGAYALICSRLGLGKPLMALNAWLSAIIFLKMRSTFRAMAYGLHAGSTPPRH